MGEQTYLAFKTAHILGAVLFVGNLVVTAVWKLLADRTREPKIVAFAQTLVTVTDVVFTGLGAVTVLVTGMLMIVPYRIEFWNVLWMMWGLGLFVVSGLVWILVLVPIQMKQARLARAFADGGEIPDSYWRLGRLWMIFGLVATVLPLVNVFLMVFKPL